MTAIQARLYLLFTPSLCRSEPWPTLEAALRGGVDLVQWRLKEENDYSLEHCAEICTDHGIPLIVNDHVEAASRLGLAGAHVGQQDMSPARARAELGPHRWLGVSTHDLQQARAAEKAGADYLGFGPMYPTVTKGYEEGQPLTALGEVIAAADLPIFAIGGIDIERLPELTSIGCHRIAVCSSILQASDPETAAKRLRDHLG
ncbi:MAG: thiamine phosphate synthase [Planctomycetota bacterium]|jgi:thiamine-phosphate pyrophosphorylase